MRIGILGAGNIGATLGRRLMEIGHEVLLGVRDPSSPKAQAAAASGLTIGDPLSAVHFGEAVVLALPLDAALKALPELPLDGRILIDTTNAFGGVPGGYASAAAAVAAAAPQARIVKAFNSGPWESIADPNYAGTSVETFICADDPAARDLAVGLAQAIGMRPLVAGGLATAGLTENLARLWGSLAFGAGLGRTFAFTLVRR